MEDRRILFLLFILGFLLFSVTRVTSASSFFYVDIRPPKFAQPDNINIQIRPGDDALVVFRVASIPALGSMKSFVVNINYSGEKLNYEVYNNVTNPNSPGANIYSGTFTKPISFLFPWDSSFTTVSGQKVNLSSPVALRIRNNTKNPVQISLKILVNEAVGGLVVNSNPSGAAVYLDNQSIGNTPIILSNIKTGSHILRISYPGYGDRQRTIIIRPHQYEYVMETLISPVNMGSLYVDSGPRGASLYLDDNYQGETPIRIDFVPIGVHTIRLSKDGYRDYVQQVFIENNKTTTIFVNLVVETTRFRLSISSNPSGASVYIDGIYRGVTPTYNYVSYGFHTIRLVLEGFKDYETNIRVTEDATFNFSLERAEGALVVFSTPPNAEVYIDGAYYGKTPITIQRLSVGRKTVQLKLSGYADWTDDVNITEGEISQVNATLKLAGTLQVSSSISGAKVYLDGKELGVTPFTSSNIPEGTHNISVELFGYKPWEGIVEVYPGQTTNIFAKLEVAPLSISEIKISPQPYKVKTLFKKDLDIRFTISKKAQVTVEIRDMNNNLIATPLSNFKASVPDIDVKWRGEVQPGNYKVLVTASDEEGNIISREAIFRVEEESIITWILVGLLGILIIWLLAIFL